MKSSSASWKEPFCRGRDQDASLNSTLAKWDPFGSLHKDTGLELSKMGFSPGKELALSSKGKALTLCMTDMIQGHPCQGQQKKGT